MKYQKMFQFIYIVEQVKEVARKSIKEKLQQYKLEVEKREEEKADELVIGEKTKYGIIKNI